MAFLRVYDDGKPLQTPEYFRWSDAGPRDGELTFVSGNPGKTSRLLTVAQLTSLRDEMISLKLARLAQERGWVAQFAERGAEARRISRATLFGVENSYKAWFGKRDALADPRSSPPRWRRSGRSGPGWRRCPPCRREVGGAWDAIARATPDPRRSWVGGDLDPLGAQVLLRAVRHRRGISCRAWRSAEPDIGLPRSYTGLDFATELSHLQQGADLPELEVELLPSGSRRCRRSSRWTTLT